MGIPCVPLAGSKLIILSMDVVISALSTVPHWLATILLAMIPVGELRVAIPVAANIWQVRPIHAHGLAVLGNILPFFPLFFGLDALREWAATHMPAFDRFLTHYVDQARSKIAHRYEQYGALALFLFTALPMPFTGLWTATIAAVALKVPFKYAFIGIGFGVVVSGLIVSAVSISADAFF